jgi:hypothetical protein
MPSARVVDDFISEDIASVIFVMMMKNDQLGKGGWGFLRLGLGGKEGEGRRGKGERKGRRGKRKRKKEKDGKGREVYIFKHFDFCAHSFDLSFVLVLEFGKDGVAVLAPIYIYIYVNLL